MMTTQSLLFEETYVIEPAVSVSAWGKISMGRFLFSARNNHTGPQKRGPAGAHEVQISKPGLT